VYPNLSRLDELLDITALGTEDIKLVADLFDKADDKFKAAVDRDIQRFLANWTYFVEEISTLSWDSLIIRYEWSFEADKIHEYAQQSQTLPDTIKQ